MTHEELLAKIDDYGWSVQGIKALRAIVELCAKYENDYYLEDLVETIFQTIEKELG